MQVGVVLPQTELGADVGAVRAFAEAADGLGYQHLTAYDHVLGADPAVHGGPAGPYTIEHPFHEPLVLFAHLAATTRLGFATGILIGPQRQTALLAKQAAEVDLVSGGRLRLGLGIGWNRVEYDALGQDFTTRGARLDEQIALLRRLWTERSVTFEGRFDTVVGAGLLPLPLHRPIPLWVGGTARPALERAGRLADGWFPMAVPGHGLEAQRAVVDAAARAAGRDPSAVEMEGQVGWAGGDEATVARRAGRWRAAGSTHLSLNTMDAGLSGPDAHIGALEHLAPALLG